MVFGQRSAGRVLGHGSGVGFRHRVLGYGILVGFGFRDGDQGWVSVPGLGLRSGFGTGVGVGFRDGGWELGSGSGFWTRVKVRY